VRASLIRYRYADLELRQQHRDEHVRRLRELAGTGRLVIAGPDPEAAGAVFVLAVPELAARAIMDTDVYVRTGVVREYSVEPFDAVVLATALVQD
jgi:uncharacterized protein YciI